jgi:hypothetical protein
VCVWDPPGTAANASERQIVAGRGRHKGPRASVREIETRGCRAGEGNQSRPTWGTTRWETIGRELHALQDATDAAPDGGRRGRGVNGSRQPFISTPRSDAYVHVEEFAV